MLRKQTRGLTDAGFFWEPGFLLKPGPGCWTVRQDQVGHWIIDYATSDPDPSPFTTIAWRLVHLGACKVMYHEYAFGHGALTWDELEIPHTAAEAVAWLQAGHALLRGALESLADADLEELRGTNWGDQWPTWRILWTMAAHDLQHGAEVGCLRDLYHSTRSDSQRISKSTPETIYST